MTIRQLPLLGSRTVKPESGAVNEQEKRAWLRLIRTENIGPITFYQLIETYGTAQDALDALPGLAARGGRKKPLNSPPIGVIEKEYARLRKLGGDFLLACEEAYPLALSAIADAPPVISVLGNPALMSKACIGIVGARNASLNGRKLAEGLARDLGKGGQVVVSGLARGIDTAAHKGSIETGTIAVVAGGIDVVYPPENQALYEEITEKGLIVAESPLGQKPFAQSFPRRNRIISGLSSGVVVVEATIKSGSLITARLAGEQGRDVYAVPGHPYDPRAAGPNKLLRDGAEIVRSAEDILEAVRDFSGQMLSDVPMTGYHVTEPANVSQPAHTQEPVDTGKVQKKVLAALSHTPCDIDELIRETSIAAPVMQTVLLELELGGQVKRLPGNRVMLV